jgi:hypothetical protein
MLTNDLTRHELLTVWQPQACERKEDWPFVQAMLLGGTIVAGDPSLTDEKLRLLQERRTASTINRASMRAEQLADADRQRKPGTRGNGHTERLNNAVATLTKVFNEGVPKDPVLTVWRAFPLFSKESCKALADRLIALANARVNNPMTQAKDAA